MIDDLLRRLGLRAKFGELIAQPLLLEGDILGIRIVGRSKRIASGNQRAQAQRVDLGGTIFVDNPVLIGVIHGRIQIDQGVALFHELPVTNMNRSDDPTLQWLNDFAVPAGNDFALRNGDHIEMAEYRPDDRRDEHRHDGPTDRAADR